MINICYISKVSEGFASHILIHCDTRKLRDMLLAIFQLHFLFLDLKKKHLSRVSMQYSMKEHLFFTSFSTCNKSVTEGSSMSKIF